MVSHVGMRAVRYLLCVKVASLLAAFLFGGLAHSNAAAPDSVMRILPNGLRLIVSPREYNKVLALNLFFEGGSAEDPIGKEGLANLTQRLLIKGADGKNAEEVAETIESVGGRIGVSTGSDLCEVYTISTVEDLDVALDLLADVALRPSFPNKEIERERELVLSGIRRRRDSQFGYTYAEFLRELYTNHPYGHLPDGEEVPLRTISRDQIVAYHNQRLRPERMVLSVCGDVEPDALAEKVERAFGRMPAAQPMTKFIVSREIKPRFAMKILKKECKQAFVVTGFPAIPIAHPDYPALRLAHAMLGEGMSARLFRRLRDEQSLAYDVGSRVEAKRMAGHLALWIGTSPENAEDARLQLLSEARYLTTEASDEESERARNYVLGKMLIGRQSNFAKSHSVGAHEAMGVGFMYEDALIQAIKQVTKSEALATLEKYLTSPISVTLLPEN